MRVIWIIFSVLVVTTVSARWDAGDLKHVDSFNFSFTDGYVSTIWGAVHSQPRSIKGVKGARVYKLKTDQFKSGNILLSGYLDRDKQGRLLKRPLVAIIPGIFSNHDDSTCLRTLNQISKLNFHVFCLPNPWSKVYIQAQPADGTLPGKLKEEAIIEHNIVKTLVADLQSKQQVTDVHLMGFSYGAFVAGVVKSLDEASAKPIFTGLTTLLSPPVRIFRSMTRLDALFAQEQERYKKTSSLQIYAMVSNYLTAYKDSDLSPNTIKHAPMVVGFQAFHRNLIKTLKLLNQVVRKGTGIKAQTINQGEVLTEVEDGLNSGSNTFMSNIGPMSIPVGPSSRKEMLDYRFEDYINHNYSKSEIDEYKKDMGNLLYWVGTNKDHRVRIMSAKDDFLNEAADWEELRQFSERSPNANLFVNLYEGGHMGYMSTKWFAKLLDVSHR